MRLLSHNMDRRACVEFHSTSYGNTPLSSLTFWFSLVLLYNGDFVTRLNERRSYSVQLLFACDRHKNASQIVEIPASNIKMSS